MEEDNNRQESPVENPDEKLVRRCVNLKKKTYDEIDELLEKSQSGNRNEFIEKAVNFYIGFLRTEKTEMYLLSTFTAAIQGTVNGAEGRIMGVIYKLAVELAMLNRIVAYDRNFAEIAIEQIRAIAEKEVSDMYNF
ncbi:MAG: hypothetical protein MJ172_11615 [Clostridia bacterium]|nr:hypothetical protein [Clostridia bacterium]